MESFQEAKSLFVEFLIKNNTPNNLFWIFRDEVLTIGAITFIFSSNQIENERIVNQIYNEGIKRNLGITLSGYSFSSKYTFAYIWIPTDENDASFHLQNNGLKLSISNENIWKLKQNQILIKNTIIWKILKTMLKKKLNSNIFLHEIPLKSNQNAV